MKTRHSSILVVEDDVAIAQAIEDILTHAGYDCLAVDTEEKARRLIDRREFAIILSDVQLPDGNGNRVLAHAKANNPQRPVILMTAYGTIGNAVDAIREGAAEYIEKPFGEAKLLTAIKKHLHPPVATEDGGVISQSPAMTHVLQVAKKVATYPATVLLTGESGVGKEVIARFIHTNSPRRDKPFVALNCASIPEDLLESILFGHQKGAFTGAHQNHAGKIQQADGGTLFLDEIGEMSATLQAKLLRVLQEREIDPIGAKAPIKVDVRFMAATHRNLTEEIASGRFRADLFYRLNVFPIEIPPLRERPEDIEALTRAFVARYEADYGKHGVTLSEGAARCLAAHHWPGNIRELENTIQRALILCQNQIQKEDLGLPSPRDIRTHRQMSLKEIERAAIEFAIRETAGDLRAAAKLLDIPYKSLVAKQQAFAAIQP